MTARRPTLASALTRRLAWIALAVVLVNFLAVALYYGRDQDALEREVIEIQMARLEAALDGVPPRIEPSARTLFLDHPRSYAFALLDRDGRMIDVENPRLIPAAATQTGIFAQDWVTRLRTADGRLLVAAHTIRDRSDELRVVFVMADDPARLLARALVTEFAKHIWLPILPIALLLIGANALMIRRGLKPIAAAAEWARSIRPGVPAPAAPDKPLPAEVQDLIDATQRSLQRVNTALAAEKRRAAEAAHALRTPVAVLLARMDALAPGETTERLRADLLALSRTVRQVLASGRADSLAGADHHRIDLVPIAGSVTAALAPLAYEKGMELALGLLASSVFVLADPDGVELALVNLVENAIIHGGGGTVEISVGPGPEVRVRDHGPGVSPGTGNRLFEPFWRDDRSPPGGTGLGLAIVNRLQQAQGGAVWVEAPPGGGAEFVLSFRPAEQFQPPSTHNTPPGRYAPL